MLKIYTYGYVCRKSCLRDEIEYQTARDNRESQMMQMYNQQGITENYPQYTTNFWGDSGNNYGFGSSDISQNIQNVTCSYRETVCNAASFFNNNQRNQNFIFQ
ncbi:MAG: hypothetical protein IJ778_05820 [Alphaproteobacteria bacterium]|nr:hypothetical protein [Alphaproteobacteria bacterium]